MSVNARGPSIACIGVIGKDSNPLHMSLFPPTGRSSLEFSFLLASCLDVFEARISQNMFDQEFGLLHAMDERLAAYGWVTTTGLKFVVIVDVEGREVTIGPKTQLPIGLRDADLKPVFRALQTAFIRLLQNPFFEPEKHEINSETANSPSSTRITSVKFIKEVERIGNSWRLGMTVV